MLKSRFTFNCQCGYRFEWDSEPPETIQCKCGMKYKKTKFKYLRVHYTGYEGVKEMIKVNRKSVDKQKAIVDAVNEYVSNKSMYSIVRKSNPDAVLKEKLDAIYSSEQQGEIESIDLWMPTLGQINANTGTVRLTLEQCKEIAKAIQ